MLSRLFRFVTAAVIFGLAWITFGEASEQGLPRATRTPVGGETSIPYGWVDFCNRHAEECTLGKLKPVDVRLTRQTWKTLNEVNNRPTTRSSRSATSTIGARRSTIGTIRSTARATARSTRCSSASCSIERGFPRQALLMTIVRDLNGEGHAVLTVKTDRGDFVLDNLSPTTIRPWNATGYQFYKRQAQDDPNVWLSLGGATGAAPGTAASN